MKKFTWLLFLVTIVCLASVSPAFAEASANDPFWGKLAGKAAFIGQGLQKTGYIIAGMGLIVFSFMAIFNKISWKNLAYIMLSCFVLTFMVALINWFSAKGANPASNNQSFEGSGAGTNVGIGGGVPPVNAEKKG